MEDELSAVVRAATTSARGAKSRGTGIRGNITPFMHACRASGGGSRSASVASRSTTRPTIASAAKSHLRMPSPRISIKPANSRTGRTNIFPALVSRWTRSSPTKTARGSSPDRPDRIRSNARRDLPEPDGPRISTARSPTSTAEAWTLLFMTAPAASPRSARRRPSACRRRQEGRRDFPPRSARHALR